MTRIDSDDAQSLAPTDTASVTYASNSWTIKSGGTVAIDPSSLSTALTALGGSAPANLANDEAE